MQTIVLHFCYFILILLFSTAYNTSLIYCFVRWCLHTNKRRPCSSTLSGHPSSSFWMWLLEDQSGPSHLGRYIEPCPSLFETMVMANGQSTGIYHDFSGFMMIYDDLFITFHIFIPFQTVANVHFRSYTYGDGHLQKDPMDPNECSQRWRKMGQTIFMTHHDRGTMRNHAPIVTLRNVLGRYSQMVHWGNNNIGSSWSSSQFFAILTKWYTMKTNNSFIIKMLVCRFGYHSS